MPRTKEQNELHRAQKRANILYTATTLFAQHGFSETTVAMVAKDAGISFGSVFTYFPSKEELFRAAVLEPLEAEFRDFLFYTGDEGASPLERIEQMIHRQILRIAAESDYLRLIQYVLGQPSRFPDLFQQLHEFSRQFHANLQPLILAGQESGQLRKLNAELVCWSYLSLLNGIRLTIADPSDHPVWTQFKTHALLLFGPLSEACQKECQI